MAGGGWWRKGGGGLWPRWLALVAGACRWPLVAEFGRSCMCNCLSISEQLFIFFSAKEDVGPDTKGDTKPSHRMEDS